MSVHRGNVNSAENCLYKYFCIYTRRFMKVNKHISHESLVSILIDQSGSSMSLRAQFLRVHITPESPSGPSCTPAPAFLFFWALLGTCLSVCLLPSHECSPCPRPLLSLTMSYCLKLALFSCLSSARMWTPQEEKLQALLVSMSASAWGHTLRIVTASFVIAQ